MKATFRGAGSLPLWVGFPVHASWGLLGIVISHDGPSLCLVNPITGACLVQRRCRWGDVRRLEHDARSVAWRDSAGMLFRFVGSEVAIEDLLQSMAAHGLHSRRVQSTKGERWTIRRRQAI